ncbi:tlde1 domain-containing protein [Massilia sp. NR 4-1]|uniref:tlde1 domain-containing protein n=1 Tax=Massilia sp. NR 4-1 TaxID=1678028 RepID=UPI000A8E9061|nr:tlde1 domain-containing protein [Massilia sp. NR 4-1]
MQITDFEFHPEAVLPVSFSTNLPISYSANAPVAPPSTDSIYDPLKPMWEDWDYLRDYGVDSTFWSDSSEYFGDYGSYSNTNDIFDGYSGVDSGMPTSGTASHNHDSQPVDKYLVYDQSSGKLSAVENGVEREIGTGYSGDKDHYNDPNSQNLKNKGPLPVGEYQLTDTNNHKGPLTISLSPDSENQMFGRNGFLIHGDNKSQNNTASEGCIILDKGARQSIINSGIKTLYVTP